MNDFLVGLFLVVLIGSIVAVDWSIKSFLGKSRREGVSQAAREIGFSFKSDGRFLMEEDLRQMQLFQRGSDQEILHVLRGAANEVQVFLFDYHYQTTTAAASVETGGYTLYRLSVAAFHAPEATFPPFELRPERVSHKIRSLFGWQDIDFPESPDFSRRYLLRSADEAQVRSLFNPMALRFFSEHRGWSVEAKGEWMAVYRDVTGLLWWSNTRVRPKKLPGFLREATEAFQQFSPLK